MGGFHRSAPEMASNDGLQHLPNPKIIKTCSQQRRSITQLLLLLLLLLGTSPDQAHAQQLLDGKQLQDMTQHIFTACNWHSYESDSSFATNLNTVIGVLRQQADAQEPYYLTNATQGRNSSSWVYAAYQCRGDLSRQNCSSCVREITTRSCTSKSNSLGLRVYLAGCYFRYENYDISGLDLGAVEDASNCNVSSRHNATSLYSSNLAAALNTTVEAARDNGGYAAISNGSAYALSQCLGSVSDSDCANCLAQSASGTARSPHCLNSSLGYVIYGSCYTLFSDTDFFFSNYTPFSFAPIVPGSTPRRLSVNVAAVVGISIASAAVLALAAFCAVRIVHRRIRRSEEADQLMGGSKLSSKIPSSTKFSVKELQYATDRFHSRNELGHGGFGVVYKGTLRNGKEVAIKVISPLRQNKEDFMNEANLITTVQHRNLIQLLGYAIDDIRWYLVYEYFANQSLDRHLFAGDNRDDSEGIALELDWKTRFNIITGVAKALCYLHEESHVRIVHRDIKASNILLDNDLEPKLADFGLARLFANGVSHLTTAVAGTLGYVAPEYAMGGQLSAKVDVYSFGLLALEIVSGRRVIRMNAEDPEETHILQWAWALYERKREAEMADRRIWRSAESEAEDSEFEGEVARAVQVGLLCTQTRPEARPMMSEVYAMLRTKHSIANQPCRPAVISMGIFSSSTAAVRSHQASSSDQSATPLTELHPR